MRVTFDTKNQEEVQEVLALLIGTPREDDAKVPKSPKKEEVIPEPTQEVKKDSEPSEEPKPKRKPRAKKITLAELKDLAKDKVAKTDRITVKNCIGKYGEKLTEVKESDYEALKAELESL